jgi:hypothetical protein
VAGPPYSGRYTGPSAGGSSPTIAANPACVSELPSVVSALRDRSAGDFAMNTGQACDRYDQLSDEQLAHDGVAIGRAFSNDVLTVNNKIFAFCKDDRLVVKLPRTEVERLVDDGHGEPFRSGGRTMREWVTVAFDDDADLWRRLMDDAREYVTRTSR